MLLVALVLRAVSRALSPAAVLLGGVLRIVRVIALGAVIGFLGLAAIAYFGVSVIAVGTVLVLGVVGLALWNVGWALAEALVYSFPLIARLTSGPAIVIHGDIVYLVGTTENDTSQDVKGQTKQVLSTIDELLAKAGTDKSKLLTAQIWLRDISDWSKMNEVWDAWVAPGNAPTRATVEAKLAFPDLLVEIMVQAAR